MTPIPLDLLSPMNAALASSNAKLAKLHRPRARLPPAANVRLPPAHASLHAHEPVAVIPISSDPQIQTDEGIINEIPSRGA
jgi:hypothetical protein